MTKYRVKKEMPGAKVGETFESEYGYTFTNELISRIPISCEQACKDGWIEEVQQEKLKDKFYVNLVGKVEIPNILSSLFVDIAKKYFLEVFDKTIEKEFGEEMIECVKTEIRLIRKALKEVE